jgi:hypothetical protein
MTPVYRLHQPSAQRKEGPEEYNYVRFRPRQMRANLSRLLTHRGVHPGALAPDFELPRLDGSAVRLSDWRGRPVLLTFGNGT